MKLNRKSYLLNNNEDDYDKMIDAILSGFYKFMVIDNYNDKDNINIYKVEYFLVGLIEMKYIINDLNIFKNYHTTCQLKKQALLEKQKISVSKENIEILNELEQILKMLETTLNVLNMDIEYIFFLNFRIIFFELLECEIKYKYETSQLTIDKYIFLPKERYHIPMYMGEKPITNEDRQRYTIVETIDDRPFKVDLATMNKYQSRIGNEKIVKKKIFIFF